MKEKLNLLSEIYDKKAIIAILEQAVIHRYAIYFINELTSESQPLTFVQIAGMIKFQGITVLLETGQTYQIGLEMNNMSNGTFQTINFTDLLVDSATLSRIKTSQR